LCVLTLEAQRSRTAKQTKQGGAQRGALRVALIVMEVTKHVPPSLWSYPGSDPSSQTRFLWVLGSVALALAAVVAIAGSVSAHSGVMPLDDPSCTNVVDTGGGDCVNPGSVVLTPDEQTILDRKNALVSEYADMLAGTLSMATYQENLQAFVSQYGGSTTPTAGAAPDVSCPSTAVAPTTACVVRRVSLTQQPQQTKYYCGPATASEVLGTRGVSKSQDTLAGPKTAPFTNLKVYSDPTNYQTSWNPYVLGPTLNKYTNSSWYSAVNGSGVGGGFSQATWQADLGFDIDNGWAIAGNIVEYANRDPHLVGHPRTVTIYHWIAIFGYSSSGSDTTYADSVHGDTQFWTWARNVPATSTISSSSMTTLLNQRGFVW
jgi:hypothetical protein